MKLMLPNQKECDVFFWGYINAITILLVIYSCVVYLFIICDMAACLVKYFKLALVEKWFIGIPILESQF